MVQIGAVQINGPETDHCGRHLSPGNGVPAADAMSSHPYPRQRQLGQDAVLPLPSRQENGRSGLRCGRNGYLEKMLRVARAARVVTGSILIIAGLIAIPLPLTPGLPLIILGLAFGFSWHPKGLRLLRKCKVKWGRLFKKKSS